MKAKLTISIGLLLACLWVCSGPVEAAEIPAITGLVVDSAGQAIAGASVAFVLADSVVAGTLADDGGAYVLQTEFLPADSRPIFLKVSSVGYHTYQQKLRDSTRRPTVVVLNRAITMIDPIVVQATEMVDDAQAVLVDRSSLNQRAHRSVVPTNPVSAVVSPQVGRQGSQHSSKLRINGTAPGYYINGVGIGTDPNHYGAFSIIPASVVEGISFYPQGTPAGYGSPAILELATISDFTDGLSGELCLSVIEATGSLRMGDHIWSLVGSLRKSVLDKLVKQFDFSTERRTLPPTNFQDVFVSGGVKLTPKQVLWLDQYYVQDFLSYTTLESTQQAGGIRMFQHTKDSYAGVRYYLDLGRASLRAHASGRASKEIYRASPNLAGTRGFALDLDERTRSLSLGADVEIDLSHPTLRSLEFGVDVDIVPQRRTVMSQTNWNFRPPDAASDHPYFYQGSLNEQYGTFEYARSETDLATYASAEWQAGGLRLRSGIRLDGFDYLNNKTAVSWRQQFETELSNRTALTAFLGSFAESPRRKPLQSYQVPIRADLDRLSPVRTYLASAAVSRGSYQLGLFAKTIGNLPTLVPAFPDAAPAMEDGTPPVVSLTMNSAARGEFVGASFTADWSGLMNGRLSVYSFYSFSHAVRTTAGVATNYDLDTPHRLYAQANYEVSAALTVGADLSVRSGHPFTPYVAMVDNQESCLTETDWKSYLATENSARFPVNASFDLHTQLNLGHAQVFLNVANATNRSNPIINTSDGFIYDAGILPSLGLRYRF